MAELIEFVDAEDAARLHLEPLLGGPSVYAAILPAQWPDELVLIRRTGGPPRDMVTDQAQLTIEARAKRASRAQRICARTIALFDAAAREGMLHDVPCYSVNHLSGPYLDPDPDHPTVPRYSATVIVAVRGVVS